MIARLGVTWFRLTAWGIAECMPPTWEKNVLTTVRSV